MTPHPKSSRPLFWILLLALTLTATGCLKTRAQLHGDDAGGGDDAPSAHVKDAPGVSQPVQDVQPQGGYAVDELKAEITRLEGRIEDLERAQKQGSDTATKEGSEQQKKLETRVTELEQAQAQMIESIKKLESGATANAAPSPELFDKAKAQYDSAQYDAAIESFTAYLKSAKAPRAEEATLLRGEAYFAQKEYKKAIVDYSRFPEKFTKSKRMPAALLKIGESFDALGMHDDAKGFYGELLEKFPKSPEAKKARTRLKG